jgi:hypothetical protein
MSEEKLFDFLKQDIHKLMEKIDKIDYDLEHLEIPRVELSPNDKPQSFEDLRKEIKNIKDKESLQFLQNSNLEELLNNTQLLYNLVNIMKDMFP